MNTKNETNNFDTLHLYIANWENSIAIKELNSFDAYGIRNNISKGLNRIKFHSTVNADITGISIDLSSKILGKKYFEGINRKNIVDVIKTINSSQDNIEIFNPTRFLESALVNRADVCMTIPTDFECKDLINDLIKVLITSNKLKCKTYDNDHKQSGIVNGLNIILQTNKVLVCYDKLKDIERSNDYDLRPDNFDDRKKYIKLELQLQKSKKIKEQFGDKNLFSILNYSDSNILLDLISNFESEVQSIFKFIPNEIKDKKYRLEVKEFVEEFNCRTNDYLNYRKNEFNRNGYDYFRKTRFPNILRLSNCDNINYISQIRSILQTMNC